MTISKYIDIDIPEAELLADLNGIQNDLQDVLEFCNRYQKFFLPGNFDDIEIEIHSIAILVKYARSFTTGVRTRIDNQILNQLSDEYSEMHRYFMSWRDKHIAHSVNVFEDNQVIGNYEDGKEKEGIISISAQNTKVLGMNLSQVENIQQLVEEVLKLISLKVNEEKAKILELTKEIDVERAITKGNKPSPPAMPELINKSRKRS